MKNIAKVFELLLLRSRFAIVLAVIASIAAGFVMILLGCYAVFWDITHLGRVVGSGGPVESVEKLLEISAVNAMDMFLIATVLFIFGLGLYELFVRQISNENEKKHPELVVHNLEQLKEKLVKVILILLVVTFFKHAIVLPYNSIADLVYFSVAILLIAISMFLNHWNKR